MAARWKWVLVAVVALLTISVLVQFRRTLEEPYLAEVPLSDAATKYRLLKLTDGPLDYDWKAPTTPPILRMLPSPLRPRYVGFSPIHLDGFTLLDHFPGVSYYFRPVDSKGQYTNFRIGTQTVLAPRIEFQESTGFIFEPDRFSEQKSVGGIGGTLPAIPRRDPMLKILIHEWYRQPNPPTHVMEIKNPFYKPDVPTWQGKSLPQEISLDDPAAPPGARVNLRRLVFDDKGNLYDHSDIKANFGTWYTVRDVWLEDATGNQGKRLSPFEPAWKVHFSIAPSPDVEYPAERVWRVGSFKRPADSTLFELSPPADLAGLKIESAFLQGAGCVETVDGKSSMMPLSADFKKGVRTSRSTRVVNRKVVDAERLESGQPILVLKSLQTDRDFAVLTRLKSATKTIGFYHSSRAGKTFSSTYTQLDRWPDDDEEWSLEVIYVKKPRVEFLVTPPDDAREILMKPIQGY